MSGKDTAIRRDEERKMGEQESRGSFRNRNVPPPVPKLLDVLLVVFPNKLPPEGPPPNAEVVEFDPKPR